MKYPLILSEYVSTAWAMLPEKLDAINALIAMRVQGDRYSEEEIAARVGGRESSRTVQKKGGVSIIPVYGVISHRMNAFSDMSGGTSIEKLTAQFRDAMADAQIGTIVLDVDSPGGSVAGVQELAAEIFAARGKKKVVAVVDPLAASAAYWLASAAEEITMTPSGLVGSIGVYTVHEDISKMLDSKGVKVTMISAGKYKTEGAPHEPLGDEAKAAIQSRIDVPYEAFVTDVARGRGVTVANVKSSFGQGRVVTAKDALAMGMVDRIATLDQTLESIVGSPVSMANIRSASSEVQPVSAQDTAPITPAAQATVIPATAEKETEVLIMSTQPNPAATVAAGEVNSIRESAIAAETSRIAAIQTLARATGMADKAAGWVREGKSVEAVSAEINDTLKARGDRAVSVPTPGAQVDLSEREQKSYSILRAIRSMVVAAKRDEKLADAEANFEREVSDTIAKKLGRETAGIYVPTNLRATMPGMPVAVLTGATAPGTNFVQTSVVPSEFIDLLRNKLVVMQLGARKLGDLVGNMQLPKQTGAGTLYWTGENPGSAVTSSDQATGNVSLSPKTAMASSAYSRQFIIQSSIDAENFVREDLSNIFALGIDLAALVGTGTSNQPKGISNQSGINVEACGTTGGAITYSLITQAQADLEVANIPMISPGIATTPGVKKKLRNTAELSNTISLPIWQKDNTVAGYQAVSSNQLPSNLTKSTGSNLHMMIVGDFAQLIIAEWGALEIIADPYTQAKKGNVEITGSMLCDIAVRYPQAFTVISDIDPTA